LGRVRVRKNLLFIFTQVTKATTDRLTDIGIYSRDKSAVIIYSKYQQKLQIT